MNEFIGSSGENVFQARSGSRLAILKMHLQACTSLNSEVSSLTLSDFPLTEIN